MKATIPTWLTTSAHSLLLAVLLVSPLSARCAAVPLGHAIASKPIPGTLAVQITQQRQPFALHSSREESAGIKFTTLARIDFTPLIAQAAPDLPLAAFRDFLLKIFLIIGAIVIAYGRYEISRGRVVEGLLCLLGGLVLALAIPTISWLMHVASSGS